MSWWLIINKRGYMSDMNKYWAIDHCSKCNGTLLGDGYTGVIHCENADEEKYWDKEPDANVVECDFNDGE